MSTERWPYTNLHDLNLDWIIDTIKQFGEEIDTFENAVNVKIGEFEGTISEYTATIDAALATVDEKIAYIDNFFSSLDVQDEINNKLDEMSASGDLARLMEPFIDDIAPGTITAWLQEHITPTTPAVDNTLTVAGAAADAKAAGDGIRKVTKAVETDTNLAYLGTGDWPGDRTSYGITYHYNPTTNQIEVSGTSTGSAAYRFFPTGNFPFFIQPGDGLLLEYETNNPAIRLEVSWQRSGSWVYNSYYKTTYITIPEDATGLGIRLVVYAGTITGGLVRVRVSKQLFDTKGEDVLQYLGNFQLNHNVTVNGVTWSASNKGRTFTATGTAADYSFLAYTLAATPFNKLLKRGSYYKLTYTSTDTKIKFQTICTRDGAANEYHLYAADALIYVPADATAFGLRMLVEPNVTVNGTATVSLTEIDMPELYDTDDVQIYTNFTMSPGWIMNSGELRNNAANTLVHTNPVPVIPGHDYYMTIKYDRGTDWMEGAFYDAHMLFVSALAPIQLTEYEYQIPNADPDSSLRSYVPMYKFTAPENARYFCYNATNNAAFKYMTCIASIPVMGHINTGDLVLKKGDPVRAYFGNRKLCVIGPSTVMIDRLYRTGNFENNGNTQSQYVVGFQEHLMPYWQSVDSYGYSAASYAKYDVTDGAPEDSIYTQIVTRQLDLSGYDDFLFVQSGNGFEREIGTVTSYSDLGNNTTYIGALRQIIDYIYQQNPQARIYIQTMRHYGFQYQTEASWNKAALLNTELRNMAALLSCPILPLDTESGFNQYTLTNWCYDSPTASQGGHWNSIGARVLGEMMRRQMTGV